MGDDARLHPALRDHPAVTALGVVAYAGAPIASADGEILRTLCVMDGVPHAWTEDDVAALADLAASVAAELELRAMAS